MAKVADVGLAQVRSVIVSTKVRGLIHYTQATDVSRELRLRVVDNPTWLAPEIMKKKPYTEKADVYAYGVILWEILTQKVSARCKCRFRRKKKSRHRYSCGVTRPRSRFRSGTTEEI